MAAYMVTYDLSQPGRNYPGLHERVKAISGIWAHITESSWIVVSSSASASGIRDDLVQAVDGEDSLFVAELTGTAAWKGLPAERTDWLKANL
ncbi:MAG: SinR family protein [bacterium]|nr:SinR family protein [bacterium]